jgi:dTDP-4-amino-4,6-dideoxygalactose transaminase
VIQVDKRDRVREVLSDLGVDAGVHYPIPIHQQLATRDIGRIAGKLSVTEQASRRILSLPMYPELTSEQLEYVAACVRFSTGAREAGCVSKQAV